MRNKRGITLISLVITIVVLIILSSVGIYFALGNNGILNKAKQAKNETIKQTATEKMNLKITNMQIEKYAEEQRMPTLQEFADGLCEDEEIQYVQLQSKKVGSLDKVEVGNASSIFTKLKEYPYEFEINSSLQLASIDGIQVATTSNNSGGSYKETILWERTEQNENDTTFTFKDGHTIDEFNSIRILYGDSNYIMEEEFSKSNYEYIMNNSKNIGLYGWNPYFYELKSLTKTKMERHNSDGYFIYRIIGVNY